MNFAQQIYGERYDENGNKLEHADVSEFALLKRKNEINDFIKKNQNPSGTLTDAEYGFKLGMFFGTYQYYVRLLIMETYKPMGVGLNPKEQNFLKVFQEEELNLFGFIKTMEEIDADAVAYVKEKYPYECHTITKL
jgi:hypothetical protein